MTQAPLYQQNAFMLRNFMLDYFKQHPIKREDIPVIEEKPIDLTRFFAEVCGLGGYEKLAQLNRGLWIKKLRGPNSSHHHHLTPRQATHSIQPLSISRHPAIADLRTLNRQHLRVLFIVCSIRARRFVIFSSSTTYHHLDITILHVLPADASPETPPYWGRDHTLG
jgi:hypothetical protein